jgi:hypothetical protein
MEDRLSPVWHRFLLNFHVAYLRDGIVRIVNGL